MSDKAITVSDSNQLFHLGSMAFWFIGYGFAFGEGNSFIGYTHLFALDLTFQNYAMLFFQVRFIVCFVPL